MANDISLAVGDSARRMTYAELAAQSTTRAARVFRISAPDDRTATPDIPPDVAPDIRTLREQLARSEATIAFQRREIEMLFALLTDRRSWWRRWFR